MSNVMSEDERVQMLKNIGINPDGEALSALPAAPVQAPAHVPASTASEVVLAPPGVDPRLQPVEEIAFDPRLLDKFPSLERDGLRAASDYVFSLYKSYGKDTPRHSALHRKISSFITATRRARLAPEAGVTEKIKTSVEQRDTAAILAAQDYDASKTAEAIAIREALIKAGVDISALLA